MTICSDNQTLPQMIDISHTLSILDRPVTSVAPSRFWDVRKPQVGRRLTSRDKAARRSCTQGVGLPALCTAETEVFDFIENVIIDIIRTLLKYMCAKIIEIQEGLAQLLQK